MFCEAVDIVVSQLVDNNVRISFAGISGTIDGIASEQWIDIYAGNWEEYGLNWQLLKVFPPVFNQKVHESSEILEYLAEELGRVAVLPSIFDANSDIGKEMLYSGFPFIASTESALKNMIVNEDVEQVLVEPTVDSLSLKLNDIIKTQGI